MRYFIANWKAEKNLEQCLGWMDEFSRIYHPESFTDLEVVICPPLPYLLTIKNRYQARLPRVKFGAQDISRFDRGKYTGETTAAMLEKIADYVIIGHSERRRWLGETDDQILKKSQQAHRYGIKTVVCLSSIHQAVPPETDLLAYEPVDAIASGNNYPVQTVIDFRSQIRLAPTTAFLYGGSVNSANIQTYLSTAQIDGLLIGTASLQGCEFMACLPKK
ncbi:triose-phosphate isomerase [Patescibacteria group bacterium]|nr:triose-phosphate isomerase [Patescibacteria group bacterium]MCL5091722.1 triose-phosphate isomerase [Patescibacteria group bacterium]